MRVEGTSSSASGASAEGGRPAFGPALARARALPAAGSRQTAGGRALDAPALEIAQAGARASASWAAAAATLARRHAAGEVQEVLRARRQEAGTPVGRPCADAEPAARLEGSAAPAAPMAGMAAAAAGQLALLVSRAGDRPSVEMAFGRELSVHIARHGGGVEVVLRAGAGSLAQASAELPALVAAIRARGVRVLRADVRPSSAGHGALTPSRRSDTNAATLGPGGTVAKW